MPSNKKCSCNSAACSKCLSGGCTNKICPIHTQTRKEVSKHRKKFWVVPQTEDQIEHNRKAIETLQAKGLLAEHEKTFRFLDDGSVIEEDEEKKNET